MKLIRKDQKEELGCGEINLANYMKCLERKKFSIELKDSPFPEAMIEFAITATPSVGGRAATQRVSQQKKDQQLTGGSKSQVLQSTKNASSFAFSKSIVNLPKQQRMSFNGVEEQKDRHQKMVETLEKDFLKQIEDYVTKQGSQKYQNEKLEKEIAELEASYQNKDDNLFQDQEVKDLQKQVEQLERELAETDLANGDLDREVEAVVKVLADHGVEDLQEP